MTGHLSILFLAAILISHDAIAQSITLAPSDPKRWDSSVTIGWLGGNKEDLAEDFNDWYDTFATSFDLGRYWTPHIKTEASATITTQGHVYSALPVAVPGQRGPVFVPFEHHYALKALCLSAAYQFFENAWVHPVLGAGAQLAWQRHRIETYGFGPSERLPVPIPEPDERPGTSFDARPFVTGGAKFYVGERGFIRTDVSGAFDGRVATRVWWRVGGGIDF